MSSSYATQRCNSISGFFKVCRDLVFGRAGMHMNTPNSEGKATQKNFQNALCKL